MASKSGKGMSKSLGFRETGSGAGVDGIGGNERNLEGSLGTQSPVGVPIVVNTESQPNSFNILTPSIVPDIKPSTK
jgi:hypothetical protein